MRGGLFIFCWLISRYAISSVCPWLQIGKYVQINGIRRTGEWEQTMRMFFTEARKNPKYEMVDERAWFGAHKRLRDVSHIDRNLRHQDKRRARFYMYLRGNCKLSRDLSYLIANPTPLCFKFLQRYLRFLRCTHQIYISKYPSPSQ